MTNNQGEVNRRTLLQSGAIAGLTLLTPEIVAGSRSRQHIPRQATPSGATLAPAILETALGGLRGTDDGVVRRFQGIPYAQPPVGLLRWAAPQPFGRWEGRRDATVPGNVAPQRPSLFGGIESLNEDCLFLNITLPSDPESDRFPVMVWIHGGGGTSGAGSLYDPKRMVRDGRVVVVTINYRLSVFGNFSFPGLADGGDFGLLDQQLALAWVREHIGDFGGDPANVTVFGESFGAYSISAHLTSPLSTGLFDRAIMQSGYALTSYPTNTPVPGAMATPTFWLHVDESERFGLAAMQQLGLSEDQLTIETLRSLPVERLLDVAAPFMFGTHGGRVLPESPIPVLLEGRQTPLPVIAGGNRDEGRLFIGAYESGDTPIAPEDYPRLVQEAFPGQAELVLEQYPLASFESPALAWSAIVTDRTWSLPQRLHDRGVARTATVYAYEFADQAAPVTLPLLQGFPAGAYHSAELGYQFDVNGQPTPFSDEQADLAETMNRYWTRFATTGDPNGADDAEWSPFGPDETVLQLDTGIDGIAPTDYVATHHLDFWESLAPGSPGTATPQT